VRERLSSKSPGHEPGRRNPLEETAHRFGFLGGECVTDARLSRLVKYKVHLDSQISALYESEVLRLGKVAGFSEDEVVSDRRLFDLLKGSIQSRAHLADLRRPKKAEKPTDHSTNS
jgi:hypothetical protein